ncbi:MAG: serine/threonine protein kinase [Labilithrix sp.]|nr:serine/threonine protein kinase [Labilithrix sp.]
MTDPNVRVVGRYALYGAIAAGGMATVHLGRLLGPVGFSRTVAIKRLHAQFASDPEFVSMFLDEARLAARIRHPNVVPTLDVVATGGELFLVMDYVPGESVARLSRALRERQQILPFRILSSTIAGVLHGLHAAHEAKDERGHPLGIVHRDVSPQNVLVGTDGVSRVLDFGVAKAAGRMQTTKEGQIKGKLSYMPPEQLRGAAVSRQTDIYAVGVMLWELVTGQRLFSGDNEGAIVARVLEGRIERPSTVLMRTRRQTLSDQAMRSLEALDATILRALDMRPEARFTTAREMAVELERKCPPATASECGDWVESIARDVLSSRAALVAEIESSASMMLEGRESHVMSVLNAKSTLGFSAGSVRPPMPSVPSAPHHPTSTGFQPYPAHVDGPPVTQPSSISVSTGSLGRARDGEASSRRSLIAALVGVMVGASVLASALVYRQSRRASPDLLADPALTAEAADAGAPAVTLLPPTPIQPPASTATVVETESVDAGVAHVPGKAAGGSGSGKPKTGGTSTKPTSSVLPPPPSPSPSDDCTTPYWYDAQGVKHYKEHCLKK